MDDLISRCDKCGKPINEGDLYWGVKRSEFCITLCKECYDMLYKYDKEINRRREEGCCDACRYKKELVKYDYSNGGCVHTMEEGYACLAPDLVGEGQVTWIVGIDGKSSGSICECFMAREIEDEVN